MWQWTIKKAEGQKNWFFWTVVLEKTLECPLSCKEIKPVNPKGNQSWTVTGRTNTEAEAPILWPPDAKSRLIKKDPDAGKHWRQKEKATIENDMVGWHHQLNMSLSKLRGWGRTGKPGVLQSMGSQSQTQLSNRITRAKPNMVILTRLDWFGMGTWCTLDRRDVSRGLLGTVVSLIEEDAWEEGPVFPTMFSCLCLIPGAVAPIPKPWGEPSAKCWEDQSRKTKGMRVFIHLFMPSD